MSKPEILFDPIDDEEFEWQPSGQNDDSADTVTTICSCCLRPNGQHDIWCIMYGVDL